MNDDLTKLVLSKAVPGPFEAMAQYIPDDDALEVIVSAETYKATKAEGDPSVRVYIGRDTEEVVGIRISKIQRHIKEPPGDIHFVVENNGKTKVSRLLRSFRTTSRDKKPMLSIVIQHLEESVPDSLEVDLCGTGCR